MRSLIRDVIRPYLDRVDEESIAKVKLAMRYALSRRKDTRFDRVFYSLLLPFAPTANPRDFFVWIWEECFPGEDFHVREHEELVVQANADKPTYDVKVRPE